MKKMDFDNHTTTITSTTFISLPSLSFFFYSDISLFLPPKMWFTFTFSSQKDVLVKETMERKTHLVRKNLPNKVIVRHKNIHMCSPLRKISEALRSCGKTQSMLFSNLLKYKKKRKRYDHKKNKIKMQTWQKCNISVKERQNSSTPATIKWFSLPNASNNNKKSHMKLKKKYNRKQKKRQTWQKGSIFVKERHRILPY